MKKKPTLLEVAKSVPLNPWRGWESARPNFESWPHYWHADIFGWSLWRDTMPELTVGERGVW